MQWGFFPVSRLALLMGRGKLDAVGWDPSLARGLWTDFHEPLPSAGPTSLDRFEGSRVWRPSWRSSPH